jgi:hypothetical protein
VILEWSLILKIFVRDKAESVLSVTPSLKGFLRTVVAIRRLLPALSLSSTLFISKRSDQSFWVAGVDRLPSDVLIQIAAAPLVPNRIPRNKPPQLRVVVAVSILKSPVSASSLRPV